MSKPNEGVIRLSRAVGLVWSISFFLLSIRDTMEGLFRYDRAMIPQTLGEFALGVLVRGFVGWGLVRLSWWVWVGFRDYQTVWFTHSASLPEGVRRLGVAVGFVTGTLVFLVYVVGVTGSGDPFANPMIIPVMLIELAPAKRTP